MRLDVSGTSYDSAAEALYSANQSAAYAYDTLTDTLTGFRALGGDDASSEDFVREYDGAAQGAVDALRSLVTGLAAVGEASHGSGSNHRQANADSVYNKPRPVYDGGVAGRGPVDVAAVSLPSSLGGDNQDLPEWWNHVVDHLQGWGWPSANTDQLRSAGSAWRSAASTVEGLTSRIDVAVSHLEGQRSPEIPVALEILRSTKTNISDLADGLRAQGSACDDYATQVDETRETIKGLLKDLAIECGVTAGASIALSFVTFGGAAAVGAGVIAARAIRYAHRIITALKALKAARAVLALSKNAPKLNRVREALDRLSTARSLVKMKRIAPPKLKTTPKQLQKKYKHAKDFGVDGNYNPANAKKFEQAVDDFVNNPATQTRSGTYHGDPVSLSFNPSTGKCVILGQDGSFVSAWELNYTQLQHVIRTGRLGGG
ncbi:MULTISPECIES: colicin D domain-containing protein [unclassified Nocardioides]|uniref:colicin D domain-containing protein n=1 Tax=unclassified Nocardioides TaxID=2615069 RepID=UPI0036073A0B